MPEPWESGYKPPTAAEAFDESCPLPRSALSALDYINRKDDALQAAEGRVAELETALRFLLGTIELGGATPEAKAEARAVLRLPPKGQQAETLTDESEPTNG